jgi:lipopolysaccharide transport system ATP-binding protein
MQAAISIDSLSKLYQLGSDSHGGYRTFRESLADTATALWGRITRPFRRGDVEDGAQDGQDLWALKDVSFDIAPGEVVGIIGRNGAGKSTLLKVLSRITEPTSGRVMLRGRVGSLLEVGTGFHHELTGRENIYLNGAILGMSRREISARFDAIVAFAEVERFLDTPVKRYSSGMFVKLAFAVASHMEPEVLIVDEVLAVGDAAFQKKCLGKIDEVSRTGRTVLFVTHNMATILHLCRKVAVLECGRLAFVGDCRAGVELYNNSCSDSSGAEIDLTNHPRRRPGSQRILGSVRLLNSSGTATDQVLCGEAVTIELRTHPDCPISQPHFAVGFDDTLGTRLFTAATYLTSEVVCGGTVTGESSQPPLITHHSPLTTRFVCRLDALPLTPGRYCLTLNAGPRHAVWSDVVDQALWFDVVPADFYGNGRVPSPDWGRFLVRSRWEATAS